MSQSLSCPIDGTPLEVSMRDDIEVRICPQCRGMWLDRSELDKIVALGEAGRGAVRAADPPPHAGSERAGFGGAYASPADQPHLKRRPGLLERLFG